MCVHVCVCVCVCVSVCVCVCVCVFVINVIAQSLLDNSVPVLISALKLLGF